jgi:hypothetical protein
MLAKLSGAPQVEAVKFTALTELLAEAVLGVSNLCVSLNLLKTDPAAVLLFAALPEPKAVVITAVPVAELAETKPPALDVQVRSNCVLSDMETDVGLPCESSDTVCQLPSDATLFTSLKETGLPLESLLPKKVSVL